MTPEYHQRLIASVCDEVRDMLLRKNRQYGNSALEPLRIIASAQEDDVEDPELDLIGYLLLKRVYRTILQQSTL